MTTQKPISKKQETKETLIFLTDRLNDLIKVSNYAVKVGHRNNYTAIDLCNLQGGCLNYLDAGLTDKEAINYLRAMLKGIQLFTNTY